MENVLVVCNFKAGRKTAIKYKKRVIKFLLKRTKSFKIIKIENFTDFDISEFDTILAMGGDGTINKILPKIVNTDKVLGIIPCGTANLLAAKLKIPTNIKKALKIISKYKTKKIDSFKVNNSLGILRFGIGYDADIICKTPQSLKNHFGYFSYFIAGIIFALRLKPRNYELIVDNKNISITASCIIVANAANMFANLFSIANKSKLTDGILDIFILKAKNPITFFYEFLKIIFNKKINNNLALYYKGTELKIKNNLLMSHIDGEKNKIRNDITIKTIPSSVNVISN